MATRNNINVSNLLRKLAFVVCMVSISLAGLAQAVTNEGKDFWVGYGHHHFMEPGACPATGRGNNTMNMKIYLSNNNPTQTATVTITIDRSGTTPNLTATWFKRTYTVLPGKVIETENMPKGNINAAASGSDPAFDACLWSDAPPFGNYGEQVFKGKGIHIESNIPIVAYAHIFGSASSGATMLLPTEAWGYSYSSINSNQAGYTGCYNWMYVIAKDSNTVVEITPSQTTRLGKPAWVPFQVTLQKGEIYQLVGQGECATGTGVQLTGTKVRVVSSGTGDCKPIAVFSGSSRTEGESGFCGAAGKDNDIQQCYPHQAWGKRYLTAPFSRSSGGLQPTSFQENVFKVVVKDPSTVVKKNGVLLSTAPPSVTVAASAASICPGTSVTFTAIPKNGGDNPTFQWKLNGGIVGTNSMTYTSSTLVNGDQIQCSMLTSASCASSTAAVNSTLITMVVANTVVPSVSIFSTIDSLCAGSVPKFVAVPVNGGTTPSYQWQVNGSNSGTNSDVFAPASLNNNDVVTCAMTSNAGCLTTAAAVNSAALTMKTKVGPLDLVPSVSITSTTTSSCPATPAIFTAMPKNCGDVTYEWLVNTTVQSGATGRVFTPSSPLAFNDVVTCRVTTGTVCGVAPTVVTSNAITITFSPTLAAQLRVYANTETLCGSNPVVFNAILPQNGGASPTYTWKVNGITKQTSVSPTFSTSTLANLDNIQCQMTSSLPAGCLTQQTVSTTISMATSNLINNSYYAYKSNAGDYIEADKPIMVAQYMGGSGTTCYSGDGDPEMVYLSPMEQAIKKVGFYRTTREGINSNYITLIVPSGGYPSLRIDNSAVFSHVYDHPRKPGYKVVIKGWPAASIQSTVSCDSGFTAITYGLGSVESYAYNAGTNLNNINGLPGFHNLPDTSTVNSIHPYTYVNTPTQLGALIAYKPIKMVWRMSELGCNIITPCADITIDNPIPADSVIIGVAKYYLYKLPPSYSFKIPGTYYLPIDLYSANADNGNCSNKETVKIEIIVKFKPTAIFTYNQNYACGVTPVTFTAGPLTPEQYTIIKYHWQFTSAPGDTSNIANPSFTFPGVGIYPVKLSITTLYGGIADTTINVEVKSGSQPHSAFTATPTTVCLGSAVTLTPTSTVPAGATTTGWWWDFGNSNTTTATTNAPQSVTYTSAGTYQVRHVITGTGYACPADTGKATIIVAVTPSIASSSSVSPTNCTGATDGSILLNGLSPNASYVVSYVYGGNTFTPTLTANASGTITIPNLGSGIYTNITVSIGSCTSNVVGPLTITNPSAPAAPTVGSNSPICQGDNLNLTADPSVSGGVYAWTGPNGFVSSTRNPTITSAGTAASGTYSVTVTLDGCISAASTLNVVVNAIPVIGSTSSTNPTTCATATGSITLNGLLSNTAYTVSYVSSSGTQTATITSSGSGTVVIANLVQGTYSNVAVSLNTCVSSIVGPFTLTDPNPPATPVASSNSPICEGAALNLTASSSTAAVSYEWTGPGTYTSNVQNPTISSAALSAAGTYSVVAKLNGCTSAATPVSVVVNPVPAVPTVGSNSPICAGSALNLTASGTSAGAVFSWTGPNSFTSTDQNPTIASATTAATGTYSVTAYLNGCTSAAGTGSVSVNAIPAIGSTSSANPTTCATATGSITLSGLLNNTAYTVNYTSVSNAQTATITSNGTGDVVIPNLPAGAYSNITVAIGSCVSPAVGPFNLSDPNPPATPVAVTSTPNICEGATISLSASSSTTGVSYEWTGPNSFTSTVQAPNITSAILAAGGTYSVVAKLNGCTSATSLPVTVVVNPIPASPTVSSNSPICAGTALNLASSSTTTGVAYAWTGPNSFTSSVQNPTIASATTAATGTYSVTASLNGCTSAAGTGSVSVNAIPAIASTSSANPTTCATATGSITLNGLLPSTSYTVTYTSGSGAQTATIASSASGAVVIPNLLAGTYSNVAVSLNNCTSPTVGPFALSDPNPPATPTASNNTIPNPICSGTNLTLTASSTTAGVSYNWTGPNGFTSTSQNPTITSAGMAVAGTYSVTATLNSCTSAAQTTMVSIKQTPAVTSSSSTNPTSCATATGSIVLNGLQPSTLYTVSYVKNSGSVIVGITSDASGVVTIPTLAAATYSNITLTLNGCTSTAVGPFTLSDPNPPAVPTASSNTPLCNGNTLNLTASSTTAGVTYNWTGPNSFTSTVQNPSIPNATSAATGNYNVTATLNSCTSAAASLAVVVNTTPNISSTNSSNPTNCNSATGSITLNGLAASTSYIVNYTKSATAQTATISTNASGALTIPSLSAGTYTSISVTIGICPSNVVGPITLTDPAPPATPTIAGNGTLCEGSPMNLVASSTTAGATFAWASTNGFVAVGNTASIPSTTVANSGTYNVVALLNGCTSTSAKTVLVSPYPVAKFDTSKFVCMPNGTTFFTNQTTIPGNGSLSYSWDFGDASSVSNNVNATHVYAASGSYTIKLTATSNGCSNVASLPFSSFYNKPVAAFSIDKDTICQGITNVFTDLSTAPNSTIKAWHWDFGNGATDAIKNPTYKYSLPGDYDISLTVKNEQGCSSDPTLKHVKVYLQPVIDAGMSFIVPQGTTIRFAPTANDSTTVTFRWTPAADFTNPDTLRPSLLVIKNQTYTLTATGQGKCTATDTMRVVALKPLGIPNAFSPNGDGINDRWDITNLGDYSFAIIEVFNRYGQSVFKSYGYNYPWDGKWNGKPLPVGTYYYIMDFKGVFPKKSGYVVILK